MNQRTSRLNISGILLSRLAKRSTTNYITRCATKNQLGCLFMEVARANRRCRSVCPRRWLLPGPMRILITFIMFLAIAACGATKTQSDADISKALIGTWIDGPSEQEPMHGKVTYFADGHSVELVWPVGRPESTAIRIETQWSVTNSILILTSVKSSNTQIVPIGIQIKDHIISISENQFVFEPAEGYGDIDKKRHVRIRSKSGI